MQDLLGSTSPRFARDDAFSNIRISNLRMRFSRFFIDRPVFAVVLSLVILAAGLLSIGGAADQRVS